MRIRPIALCLGVAVTPSFALTAKADAGYNVTVLQDVGGQGFNLAQGINAFGQTVGYSSTAIGYDAVHGRWREKRRCFRTLAAGAGA